MTELLCAGQAGQWSQSAHCSPARLGVQAPAASLPGQPAQLPGEETGRRGTISTLPSPARRLQASPFPKQRGRWPLTPSTERLLLLLVGSIQPGGQAEVAHFQLHVLIDEEVACNESEVRLSVHAQSKWRGGSPLLQDSSTSGGCPGPTQLEVPVQDASEVEILEGRDDLLEVVPHLGLQQRVPGLPDVCQRLQEKQRLDMRLGWAAQVAARMTPGRSILPCLLRPGPAQPGQRQLGFAVGSMGACALQTRAIPRLARGRDQIQTQPGQDQPSHEPRAAA